MKKWLKRIAIGIAVFLLVYGLGLVWAWFDVPKARVTTYEFVPPGETDSILRLVRKATKVIAEQSEPDNFTKRDAHAQPHGCVKAVFQVEPAIDAVVRHGVYATPGRTYPAWIRFSNGTQQDDTKPDARGMAIKLMNVSERRGEFLSPYRGPSQDFVMINYPVFFNRSVVEYEDFFTWQAKEQPLMYFVSWSPLRWKVREMKNALETLFAGVSTPLDAQYHSMTAYRLGPHNTKFSAKPCEGQSWPKPKKPGPHFLREALVQQLKQGDACFEMLVQVQDPSKNMPIEDPTVLWRERDSPFRKVAQIHIPRQTFSTDAQNQFCEQLSFAPWHALESQQPVGGLNRVRKAVYEAVSVRRHARNEIERHEPRGWCLSLDGRPCPEDAPASDREDAAGEPRPDGEAPAPPETETEGPDE